MQETERFAGQPHQHWTCFGLFRGHHQQCGDNHLNLQQRGSASRAELVQNPSTLNPAVFGPNQIGSVRSFRQHRTIFTNRGGGGGSGVERTQSNVRICSLHFKSSIRKISTGAVVARGRAIADVLNFPTHWPLSGAPATVFSV